mgnify:CR=1 FL=1
MARKKKKVSWNEQLLLELEELAEMLGKRFSDVVNEVVLLGLDAYKKKYADRLKRKEETGEKKERSLSEEYLRRVIFDIEHADAFGWQEVGY